MDLEYTTKVFFLALAVVLLLLERIPQLRRFPVPLSNRWLTNLGLFLLSSSLLAIIFPDTITTISNEMTSGLVRGLHLPLLAELVLVFLLMDCWNYWQHRVMHEVPLLWRLHLVHHSDTSIDVTTGVRHHPFEGMVTTAMGMLLVFALGFSALALGIYLLVAMLSSLYTHANIALPPALDKRLRRALVTPAIHAIHHSDYQPETDSNYGTVLTIWDRMFGTYTSPDAGPVPHYGLEYFRRPEDTALGPALLQPFEYRKGMRSDSVQANSATADTRASIPPEWRKAMRYSAIGFAIVALLMVTTVFDLGRHWAETRAYQYAWLILPVFLYVLFYGQRERVLALLPTPGRAGWPLLIVAALGWGAAFMADLQVGQHLAFVVALQGIALNALGRSTYLALLPTMLFLFLMVPSGDVLYPPLEALTVEWVVWFSQIMDLPLELKGNAVTIGEQSYRLVRACAGLPFVTLGGFLGYSFGLLLYTRLSRVWLLAALGAGLGVLTNGIRIWMIVGLDQINQTQMELEAHQDIQWITLLLCLGLMLLLASHLEHEREHPASATIQS